MPKLDSPKKALRSDKTKAARNKKSRNKIARIKNKALKLIEMGEVKLAQQQVDLLYKELDKASKNNVVHPNKAARTKSRVTKKLNSSKNVKTAPKNS